MSGPYLTTIPVGTDAMELSCQQLRGNYTQIFNAFAENHIPLNDDNQGMHSQLELVQQGGDPATGTDEVALYSKAGTGSQPQIFFRPKSSGTPIQISNNKVISTGPKYQSFLAGPYIFLFGKLTGVHSLDTITYTTLSPNVSFSEIEFIDLQVIQDSVILKPTLSLGVDTVGLLSFRVVFNIAQTDALDMYYAIIGKPS